MLKITNPKSEYVLGTTHPTLVDAGQHLNTEVSEQHIGKFAYLLADRSFSRHPFVISTYPREWMEIYTYGRYHLNDPVIRHAMTRVTPFVWHVDDPESLGERDNEVFHQARNFNVSSGYTFVVHGTLGEMGVLSVCGVDKHRREEFDYYIRHQAGELQMLLMEVHQAASSVFCSDDARVNAVKQLNLSERERSVIYWASQGKTYHEIGIILGFKERTIKKYMASVVSKLEVTNAKHAISKSIELQLVRPVP
ncbi:helix-turn-helix transcriptional regulator [Halotalea alkalilenta]|uniref:helix-turn-helix transcriptional regulator n=1 Tax=Halotalea alkalilenta TaxID=376489 RepID=UPI000694BD5B|nr:LuxR family transcriptional regulator [Halotalea alkalilenta]